MASASSRSEDGEIQETQEVEKAPPSLPSVLGPSVDRHPSSRQPPSRDRSYEQSGRYSSKRRRSPSHDCNERDPRSFKPRYEPEHPSTRGGAPIRRPRVSYADIDHGDTRHDREREYHDRERSKRSRTRSTTPPSGPRGLRDHTRGRGGRYDDLRRGEARDHRSRGGYEDGGRYRSRERSSFDGQAAAHLDHGRREAEANRDSVSVPREEMKNLYVESNGRNEKPRKQSSASAPVEIEEPVDEDKLIEERRKKREALKAKLRGQATPALANALGFNAGSPDESAVTNTPGNDSLVSTPGEIKSPGSPASPMRGATPTGDFIITKGIEAVFNSAAEEPSAADYDPTLDMREDRTRNEQRRLEVSSGTYDEMESEDRDVLMPDVAKHRPSVPSKLNPKQQEKDDSNEDDFDMFAEGDDDMFASEPSAPSKKKEEKVVGKAVPILEVKQLDGGMLDNWDDEEGYYKVIPGELLDGRYRVHIQLGKGMFSGVIRAMDMETEKLVAIKIIRNSEAMRKAGMKELAILRQLHDADPKGVRHIVQLERHFEHKSHLCIVFEHLSLNLREVLKKSGIRDVGISLQAVRAYAHQIFLGLDHLKRCKIIHADIKPDNILITDKQNILKIADLGSASDVKDNDITPYLVSRFYRAPEIILGMPYDYSIDMWSVGCTLYELYTGKILFTGRTNNQMLKGMMECRGRFSLKLLKKGKFWEQHFDDMGNLLSREQDKITGKDVIRTITITKPTRELKQRLMSAAAGSESESKDLNLFVDLLERCLNLNPEKRCSPSEAVTHAFITGGKTA